MRKRKNAFKSSLKSIFIYLNDKMFILKFRRTND